MDLRELAPLAVAFIAVAVTIGLGASIVGQMRTDTCVDQDGGYYNTTSNQCEVAVTNSTALNTGYAYNSSTDGLESLEELGSWLPTIALVIAAAIIIGIVVVYLARRV